LPEFLPEPVKYLTAIHDFATLDLFKSSVNFSAQSGEAPLNIFFCLGWFRASNGISWLAAD
jgi:hypothetical protein